MKEEVVNEFSIKLVKVTNEQYPDQQFYNYICDTTCNGFMVNKNQLTCNETKSWMYNQLKKYFIQITKYNESSN